MTCDITNVTTAPFNCVFDGYTDTITEVQLGLLVSCMVAMPLYAKYEDPVVAAVGLAIVSGPMFAFLPAFVQGVAWVVLFLGLTVAIFTVMYRTVLT